MQKKITYENPRPEFGFGLATILTLTAFLFTRFIPELMIEHVCDLFMGAVFFSAWYAGAASGAVAVILSALIIDYFFLPPLNAFGLSADNFIRLVVFGIVAFLTSLLSARLRHTQHQLQRAYGDLEARVAERTQDLSLSNKKLEEEIAGRLEAQQEILQISSREQRRLGEDLHDGLCQTLVGVRLLNRELRQNLAAEGSRWTEDAQHIEMRLTEALMQADIVSRGLYPVELETHGLMAALQELADKLSVVHRVSCRLICREPVLIHDSTTSNYLYRIVQEAVTNSFKRGKAKRVRIRLIKRRQRILLAVTDDGIGLQTFPMRHGMGLKMMHDRAKMINADLKIKSRLRGVTRVSCSLTGAFQP